jgi:hypothetical protein
VVVVVVEGGKGVASGVHQVGFLPQAKPIGYNWSYLACRIGHLVPIWQPCIRSSFHSCPVPMSCSSHVLRWACHEGPSGC